MKNEMDHNALLSDVDLLIKVKRLTADERHATSRLIAALGELDARRLYRGEGCSSLFTYCTQILHLSEHSAYLRIEAARAARKWPGILDLLADGAPHLTAVGLLAPHLTADNHDRVLAAARHRTKREIEEIVAALRPQPAVAPSVRKLPALKSSAMTAVRETPLVPEPADVLMSVATTAADAPSRETRNRSADESAAIRQPSTCPTKRARRHKPRRVRA